MGLLFSIGMHNAAVMAVLALLIWVATRFWKSAPVAHLLWVLVLVKLLTPPVVSLDASRWADFTTVAATPAASPAPIGTQPDVAVAHEFPRQPERSVPVAVESTLPAEVIEPSVVPDIAPPQPVAPAPSRPTLPSFDTIRTVLASTWLIGAVLLAGLAWIRIVRFQRMLAQLPPAPERLQALADDLAQRMGMRHSAAVLQVESALPPFVWCFGSRRIIVVPHTLLDTLGESQLALVLAHELAHLRRRDHWVRVVELAVSVLYWWNPLVWWVRRQLHAAEEQCCDAWVLWLYPDQNQLYAESLLKSADVVAGRSLALSSPFLNSHTLKGRIESVLKNSSQRSATRRAVLGLGLFAVATLPLGIAVVRGQVPEKGRADQNQAADRKSDAQPKDSNPLPSRTEQAQSEVAENPPLRDLMQQMAVFERAYFPYDVKVMETFRFPDDLTPQERAKNLRADGRKHERLMEYAQLAPRIWRDRETDLVDDEVEQGPYERFSDGEQIIQRGPSSLTINGVTDTEYYISKRQNEISNYLSATPLLGIFCLSRYSRGELFSEAFQGDENAVELAWENGDAKLTFVFGKPHWNTKYVLWLSRAHAWQPFRLQRYWDAKDKFWHDEWEITRFVRRGNLWRIAEGTHRYRELKGRTVVDPKITHSMDFKVLAERYGSDVDEKQFHIEIPPGAKVREADKPDAEPPPPAKAREIAVTVVDVDGKPVPQASVKLPATRLRDYDLMTTDEQGVARSAKAPADKVTVQITADGFRPVTWIMGNVDELRAIMAPVSFGTVTAVGKPVADAWVTNETLQIRADGYAYVPSRDWDGRDQDWSDSAGKFELKTPLTLRRDAVVPLIAINPDRDRMAIRFLAADQLAQPQPLVLQPVCHVRGRCLLEGVAETVDVSVGLASSAGQSLGFLSTRRALVAGGLRVEFQLRLPPGDYVLKSRGSSHHAGFSIPFSIAVGQSELDLGTKTVPAAATALLRGKPAPALDVLWRPGQEVTWEKLHGKVVVLDFWGTWCGPCVSDTPVLMDIAQQFREKPVEWIAVHTPNLETFEKLDPAIAQCQQRFWNNRALPFTTVIDRPITGSDDGGKTERSYGVVEWPTLIVVNQQGLVVGAVHKNKLAETIDRLIGENVSESAGGKSAQSTVDPKKDRQPFRGHWTVDLCESEAATLKISEWDARRWRWSIKGDEITWGREGQEWRMSFKIDAATTPKQIDLTFLDGPHKDQQSLGIYDWDGNEGKTLKILMQDPGAKVDRPTSFATKAESQTSLIVLHSIRPVDPVKELAVFQGRWCWNYSQPWTWPQPIGVGTDSDGRKSEKRWVIDGNRITWVGRDGQRVDVTFSIDPFKAPKQIDFTFINGPHNGKKSIGIYEPINGDENNLWLCMTDPGADAPRPTDISAGGSKKQSMIAIYKVEPTNPAVAKELEPFQGFWWMGLCDTVNKTLYLPNGELPKRRWRVKGNQIVWSQKGEEWRLQLKVDPSKSPKEIDLKFLSGPFAGKTCLGMYQFGGVRNKTLEIAIQDPGASVPRPAELMMTGTSQTALIFLSPIEMSEAQRDRAVLQGIWTLRNFDTGNFDKNKDPGSWPLPTGKGPDSSGSGSELRWVVQGNEITWTSRSGGEIQASFTIDPMKRPKQIDLTFLSGPDKGETCPGIYQHDDLDENILWLCVANPGSKTDRPKEFSYEWGKGRSLLSLYPFESSTAVRVDASPKDKHQSNRRVRRLRASDE